jgi:hypothetical protein
MTSEESWVQINDAHNKDQWASLLELCALHLKENPDHIQARIPQAIALRHLKRFDGAVTLLQETSGDPRASEKCKYQCQTQLVRHCKKWQDSIRRAEPTTKRIA